jgi:alpha-tubulin suppressor-like RCC1 family protein
MNKRGLLNILMVPVLMLMVVLGVADASLAVTPQVAAAADFTITLRSNGTIWATGINDLGQLGDGTVIQRNAPVQAGLLLGNGTGWTAVAAGADHAVALKADGTLWTWGGNGAGQLGIGTTSITPTSSPVQVGTDTDWTAVAAGAFCTIALKGDGTLWAWGVNDAGQLGNADITGTTQPSPVAVLNQNLNTNLNIKSYYVAVSISNRHALALQADGSLWAWGDNQFGQLAADPLSLVSSPTPQQIIVNSVSQVDTFWTAISAGGGHSVASLADGSLWSWGADGAGQLGTGSLVAGNEFVPARVGIDSDWEGFSSGDAHTLALKRNGTLWVWGANSTGQLGTGAADAVRHSSPAIVASPVNITAVAAGTTHSLAAKANGDQFAWGGNAKGQLGSGTIAPSTSPILVAQDAHAWVSVELGGQHTLARRTDGSLWAWGDNSSGQASLDPAVTTRTANPVQVGAANNWLIISGGFIHAAAIQADGSLWTWGSNGFGQLGDNSTIDRFIPQQITLTATASAANDWIAVSAGDAHTLALKTDGSLWAWGDNFVGQLGDGSTTPQILPIRIITGNPGNFDNNWVAVSAGSLFSIGLQADGTLWGWGDNSFGQLAIDPLVLPPLLSVATPQQIINFVDVPGNQEFNSNWTAIAAGQNHWLGLQGNGTVWGLGDNSVGQLGIGVSTANQFDFLPTLNAGPPVIPYVSIAAGDSHSAMLKSDGSLWLMGNNTSGQLGIAATDPDPLSPAVNANPRRENSNANDWVSVSAGGRHTVALKAGGALSSWGENDFGQMGDGTTNPRNAPVALNTTFDASPLLRRTSDTLSGSILQPLYDTTFAIAETIQLRSVTIIENTVFARPGVTVDLRGGYDVGFATVVGTTTINGAMYVKNGKVTAKNIVLKSLYPQFTTVSPLADGQATVPYAASIAATGGVAPYSFAFTGGTLPTGLTLAANGQLSGTPIVPGAYDFTVTVTDSATVSASSSFTMTIVP